MHYGRMHSEKSHFILFTLSALTSSGGFGQRSPLLDPFSITKCRVHLRLEAPVLACIRRRWAWKLHVPAYGLARVPRRNDVHTTFLARVEHRRTRNLLLPDGKI